MGGERGEGKWGEKREGKEGGGRKEGEGGRGRIALTRASFESICFFVLFPWKCDYLEKNELMKKA